MKEIALTQKQFALVDDEDYEWLAQWKWCVVYNRGWRVSRGIYKGGSVYMSRAIMENHGYRIKAKIVDHKDRNGLDNRKQNLRTCTTGQNQCNGIKRYGGRASSKYKGVCWFVPRQKWQARISWLRRIYFLGYFNDEIDAAKAYNEKAKKLHGEFARLNDV